MVRKNKLKYQVLKQHDDDVVQKGKKKQQRLGSDNKRRVAMKAGRFKEDDNDESFRRKIEDDGTKVITDMAADGNCLFRSLSDQIYWDYGNKHEEVRSDVCDFLALHKDEFSVFLVLDENEEDEDAADFESYVSNMRTLGEWGGNLEIVAAARLYCRNIKVFSSAVAYTIEHGAAQSSGADLMVSYHDNDHYNSIRDTKASKPPPPLKRIPTKVRGESTASRDERCVSFETKGESAVDTAKQVNPAEEQNDKLRRKDAKKGGMCPCGSGKSYRKCCRGNTKKGKAPADESPAVGSVEAPKKESTVENGFKVLRI